jgi:hypothetical protein
VSFGCIFNIFEYIRGALFTYQAINAIAEEERRPNPSRTNQIAQGTFAVLQATELVGRGARFTPKAQLALRAGTGVLDTARQRTSGQSVARTAATALNHAGGVMRYAGNNSLAVRFNEVLAGIGTWLEIGSMVVANPRPLRYFRRFYAIGVVHDYLLSLHKIGWNGKLVDAPPERVAVPAPEPRRGEGRPQFAKARHIPNREQMLARIAWDENFLQWFRAEPEARDYLCPLGDRFLLNPVHNLLDPSIIVDQSSVEARESNIQSVQIRGAAYPLDSFEAIVDEVRKAEGLRVLSGLIERYSVRVREYYVSQHRWILEWRSASQIDENLRNIVSADSLPRCAITGRLIRYVVVPTLDGTLPVYYEKETFRQWMTLNPARAPEGWPAGLHLAATSLKVDTAMQDQIDRTLEEAARNYSLESGTS